jgi:hypothetical protein
MIQKSDRAAKPVTNTAAGNRRQILVRTTATLSAQVRLCRVVSVWISTGVKAGQALRAASSQRRMCNRRRSCLGVHTAYGRGRTPHTVGQRAGRRWESRHSRSDGRRRQLGWSGRRQQRCSTGGQRCWRADRNREMTSFQPVAGPRLHTQVERKPFDEACRASHAISRLSTLRGMPGTIVRRCASTQFDPTVVAAMKSVLEWKVASRVA